MDSLTSCENAFQSWKDHSSGSRVDTDLSLLEIFRRTHPGHHVTRTPASTCALLPYGKAGFATATPSDRDRWDASREFMPAKRLEKTPGELFDNNAFARWLYKWNDKEFIVYHVQNLDRPGSQVSSYYVLSPSSDVLVTEGHHADTDALLLASGAWTQELHEEIEVFDTGRWKKSKELYNGVKGATWDEVILDPPMKANLIRDVQDFFNNRAIYESLNVPWKRGLIFHGVPGNGKTVSLKALINSLGARPDPIRSLYVKSLDSRNCAKWSIQTIFDYARKMSPCLLIFEDLDSMVQERVRSYFLNEVDGLESNEGILMIGSTNHLDKLDSAITKRPSRFDRKYHFKLPGEAERVAYCQFWCQKFAGSDTVDFPDELCFYIAKLTAGFSFAYLKELFISSLLALARGGDQVSEAAEVDTPPGDAESSAGSFEAVVLETSEGTAATEEGNKTEEAAKDDKKAVVPEKPKLVLPDVEVPEALRDNLLRRISKAQAQFLLDEMDNSVEDGKKEASP